MTRGAPTTTPTTTPTLHYFTAPPARRARFIAWILCAAALVGGTIGWIFLLRGLRIAYYSGTLFWGWLGLGSLIILLAVLLKTAPVDAIRLSRRASWWIIILGTAAMQAAALLFLLPALTEDPLRYRLDGAMWLRGYSPYSTTPTEYLLDELRRQKETFHPFVPFRDLHTIYPPTAQAAFVTARVIEQWVIPQDQPYAMGSFRSAPPLHTIVLRIMYGLTAVAATSVLLSILRQMDRSLWYAVLLGWNPLFVLETGGMGHVDVVGVLFILLTIRALQAHRPILAAAMLALAAGVKPPAILLAPFLFRDARAAGASAWLKFTPIALGLFLGIVYSPLLYQQGYRGWLRTSSIYAKSWEANGSIYELIKRAPDALRSNDPSELSWRSGEHGVRVQRAKDWARLLASGAVVGTIVVAWLTGAGLASAGYWIFLVALLTSPVVYPWYLLWVLCFVPLLPARGGIFSGVTALVWSATIGVSYLLWRTPDWILPARWLLVEYVPVYAMLVIELIASATRRESP